MSEQSDFGFSKQASTAICDEQPDVNNSYVCAIQRLAGYDTLELTSKSSFIDVLLLLFRLDLPEQQEKHYFEALMIGLINPGPRHPATRAAMSVGISKANPEHILPIALNVLGGERGGAAEVIAAYQFIEYNQGNNPKTVASSLKLNSQERFAPGFGRHFGQADTYIKNLSQTIAKQFPSFSCLQWAITVATELESQHAGLLDIGLAAAVCCDLSLGARESAALYQYIRAPGLIAHGLEQTHRPITDIPMVEDHHYVYEAHKP